MNPLQEALTQRLRNEAQLLELISTTNPKKEDLARWGGFSEKTAARLLWITRTLPTWVFHTAARTHHIGIAALDAIASGINTLCNPDVDKQALIRDYLAHADTLSVTELDAHIRTHLNELNKNHTIPRKARLAFNANPDVNGHCFLQGAGPAELVAQMRTILTRDAEEIRRAHPNTDMKLSEAMFSALAHKILSERNTDNNHDPYLPYRPCYVIACDPTLRYHSDGKAITTDGSLINLTDIVNQETSAYGYAIAYTLTEGGDYEHAGTWGLERFFNNHQRFIATIENPLCAHPGCNRPATNCQGHHIHAWSHGGATTNWNHAPLCAPHNAQNDDTNTHHNGRIERCPTTGILGLKRHPTSELQFNNLPVARKGIRRWLAQLKQNE
ncbi:MAG: HNH endonuclease signature motif containing protein [Corynebacterium sp.]|uniref:HNH endonuclease signature motif containing protein n=1 Tax=Corynebacterium sp. TaxID=1720 RepID=UPI0026DBF378|nr:HNH endonuclease signature motif containing protein [Corynebacterium sp.]MDO4760957.1 HNH endonuclease signature motif containing protein [Corynebacterium sp.]